MIRIVRVVKIVNLWQKVLNVEKPNLQLANKSLGVQEGLRIAHAVLLWLMVPTALKEESVN